MKCYISYHSWKLNILKFHTLCVYFNKMGRGLISSSQARCSVSMTNVKELLCQLQINESICGNEMPTRCNRGFYCRSYCFLNMFRAPLCPSSGAQEYYTVVANCGMHPAKRTHNPQLHTRPATWKTTARNTTGSNHCILLSSWWWA